MKKILLVSESDGSYAHALAKSLEYHIEITAWFQYSERETKKIYPDHKIDELKILNVELKFGMDLFALPTFEEVPKFDVIQFNFPHLGIRSSSKNWNSRHNKLLRQYFSVAKELCVDQDSEIRVVLSTSSICRTWDVDGSAKVPFPLTKS